MQRHPQGQPSNFTYPSPQTASPPPMSYSQPQQYQQPYQHQYHQAQRQGSMQHILAGQYDKPVQDEEYNRLLKNYRLAHERIEETRLQMLEQEKQNAILRKHITLLEGNAANNSIGGSVSGGGGTTVDDFTIKNSSSGLERKINRWAADTVSTFVRLHPPSPALSTSRTSSGPTPSPLIPLAEALFSDAAHSTDSPFLVHLADSGYKYEGLGLVVQSLLRHVMSRLMGLGIVNELLVTNSEEANRELTRLHEELFNREPLVASVWRRQTFSASVESLDAYMIRSLFAEHMPRLFRLLNPSPTPTDLVPSLKGIVDQGYTFSRMLHSSKGSVGGGVGMGMETAGYFKAFVPELGTTLDPTRIELVKRCYRTERGESERVGACLFPGLAKMSAVDMAPVQAPPSRMGDPQVVVAPRREERMIVVRRAQVICECALASAPGAGLAHSTNPPP